MLNKLWIKWSAWRIARRLKCENRMLRLEHMETVEVMSEVLTEDWAFGRHFPVPDTDEIFEGYQN